ncbi:unnamed protein product [Paramecium sonneborni]|uniref:Transmembrane protein n=1 Tax=Paramecium sonneborni TaxID=65129 RepID=A0A8S1RUC0_9CILI|nr:unnamed protein product [Paramecium sonneborni]
MEFSAPGESILKNSLNFYIFTKVSNECASWLSNIFSWSLEYTILFDLHKEKIRYLKVLSFSLIKQKNNNNLFCGSQTKITKIILLNVYKSCKNHKNCFKTLNFQFLILNNQVLKYQELKSQNQSDEQQKKVQKTRQILNGISATLSVANFNQYFTQGGLNIHTEISFIIQMNQQQNKVSCCAIYQKSKISGLISKFLPQEQIYFHCFFDIQELFNFISICLLLFQLPKQLAEQQLKSYDSFYLRFSKINKSFNCYKDKNHDIIFTYWLYAYLLSIQVLFQTFWSYKSILMKDIIFLLISTLYKPKSNQKEFQLRLNIELFRDILKNKKSSQFSYLVSWLEITMFAYIVCTKP